MKLDSVFDIFSRRRNTDPNVRKPLGDKFRNRVLLLCNDTYGNVGHDSIGGDFRSEFWDEIHKRLQYLHGRPRLSDNYRVASTWEDTAEFLLKCSDDHFLDFVEHMFRTYVSWRISSEEKRLERDINKFFDIDDLPYYMAGFVRETSIEIIYGREREVFRVVSYPQVICKEDEITHIMAIEPTLFLLSQPRFNSANNEFRAALEDYRRQDYSDCLVKCNSSFESVMKVICDQRGWRYKQADVSGVLLTKIMNESRLPQFFRHPLLIVATLRNELSSSHGAGTQKREVSQGMAKFSINSTSAAILFLVEETS